MFPISPLARRIFALAAAADASARIVGGAVRDWLQDRSMGDIDMAVAMPIADAAALFRDAGLKVVETGLEHGTVTVIADGEAIEVTQTRVDLDTDGRHATVAFSDDWRADAARRDFTVNSLYVTADGMVEDPLDCAHQDLDAGRLRFVGEAARRVEEDALRMLRYCRFLPRFHDGGVDAEAMAALSAAAHLAAGLSGERVAGEMRRLLGEEGGQIGLRVMEETGLSLQALGVSTQSDRLTPEIDRLVDVAMGDNGATWLVRLAVVMPLSSAPVLSSRLRLSRREQGELTKFDTVSPETEFAALTGQRWHQAAYWCHREGSLPGPQLIVAAARLMREIDKGHFAEIAAWVPPVFPLTGAVLLSHGVDKGPVVGEMLREAEQIWVAADFSLTKDELATRIGVSSKA
ncbi:MAG: CCA tRNA nucleotidyltransferase [Pseudomonadota bacterium]|nr:CCA tRNA nucleotidyltransferase [Pseudomonadota bacterium]